MHLHNLPSQPSYNIWLIKPSLSNKILNHRKMVLSHAENSQSAKNFDPSQPARIARIAQADMSRIFFVDVSSHSFLEQDFAESDHINGMRIVNLLSGQKKKKSASFVDDVDQDLTTKQFKGPYWPTTSFVLFSGFFLYLALFECSTTSDWLNRRV